MPNLEKNSKNRNSAIDQNDILLAVCDDILKLDCPERILEKATHDLLRAFSIYSASIALYNENLEILEVKMHRNSEGQLSPNKFKIFKLGEGVAGLAAKTRKTVYVKDIKKSPVYIGKRTLRGAIISVPMVLNGKLIGVISLRLKEDKILTKEQIDTLTILSTIIAGSIENARLYAKMSNQVDNLSAIFGISSIVGRQTRVTVQKIIGSVPALLESEKAHLLIADSEKKFLYTYAYAGEKNEKILKKALYLKEKSFSATVFDTQKPKFTNNAENDSLILPEYKKAFRIKNQLSVPVIAGENPIGVLHVMNKYDGNFTDEDMKMASIVATRVGNKIENSRLLEKTETEKELLDSIIANSQEGILVIDNEDKVIIWNKFLENIFGIRPEEIIGKPGLALAKQIGTADLYWKILFSEKKDGKLYLEKEVKTINGEKICLGITVSPLALEKGRHYVVLAHDISKERELIQAKNDLISTATHELRTPVTAIKGYLSMILNGDAGKLTPEQEKYAARAYGSTERLVNLLEDLLSTLRIDENRTVLNKKQFILNEIIDQSVDQLLQKAIAKNIRIKSSAVKPLTITADPEKTKQIFDNIIDNAIKYTNENGKITIKSTGSKGKAIVEIKDTGVGIPAKKLESIFERFSRVQNPLSIKAGGTGLGLYIAKNLAEKQNGKIWVKSQLNKGSSFFIELPIN